MQKCLENRRVSVGQSSSKPLRSEYTEGALSLWFEVDHTTGPVKGLAGPNFTRQNFSFEKMAATCYQYAGSLIAETPARIGYN